MIEKITDHSLERYDSRLKEWCDRKFFEKGNYGKYETTEEAGAVAFYPAPNTPLEGKVKFSFKETMPANGDKSPDNPSTITGVTQAKVTRCGKNLVKIPFFEGMNPVTKNGITFTPSIDGSITVSGTATSMAFFTVLGNSTPSMRIGQTYTLSGCPSDGSLATYSMRFGTVSNGYDFGSGCTRELVGNGDQSVVIRINAGTIVSNLVFRPQLELDSTATSFEKYEGSDATINLSSTYYGGEIDLATGLMTVTNEGIIVTDALDIREDPAGSTSTINSYAIFTPFTHAPSAVANADTRFCTHFISTNSMIENVMWSWGIGNRIGFRVNAETYPTLDSFKNFLNQQYNSNTPVTVVTKLDNPFTVQLSSQQILSLSQLDKYTPRLNTVYTDADSVQISYLKSPIRDEYEKTQAILSLGGNS